MTLKSMTGFARVDDILGRAKWHWEVRSVNARGLDVRLRLPPGLDSLEPPAREAVTKRFTRGTITASLTLQNATVPEIRLNEPALEQVVRAAERARGLIGGDPPRIDGLLALKGVLEVVEPEDNEEQKLTRNAAILGTLARALDGLAETREAEGARLSEVVGDQLKQVESLVNAIAAAPGRTAEAIRQRLQEQVARLSDTSLDSTRLHQEAVLLAARSDVEEELKRLFAHLAAARDLLSVGEPVGRKLDFLAQEFHREANTLCAKANDPDMTRSGLTLKVVIEQMREQVQNIE